MLIVIHSGVFDEIESIMFMSIEILKYVSNDTPFQDYLKFSLKKKSISMCVDYCDITID